ncbi:lysyl-tRNA synthetase [Weissella oryzae SG25]|uniref:Lysyl-tRNA synthetase n=1 Tax=Weissella oryzae (strain DSM 25784 / JCM 18191 / LMG 30913 / SG25) TaxID=1329250 RepID=A0A069CVZ1_WEIOS|nr:lysyl-tRNA synthetase [Weissella oryzae SG25]
MCSKASKHKKIKSTKLDKIKRDALIMTEHRAQSTEHRAQSTEHRAQSTFKLD